MNISTSSGVLEGGNRPTASSIRDALQLDSDSTVASHFADEELERLVNSFVLAHGYREDVDYVVQVAASEGGDLERQIVIVDHSTGQLLEGQRWSERVHQFVELKHGISPSAESCTIAEISHVNFFRRYRRIYGLTGTIGSAEEREELSKRYSVDNFDAPPHVPSLRVLLPTLFTDTEASFRGAVIQEVQDTIEAARPCLLLCDSIVACRKISGELGNAGIENQVLDGVNGDEEDFVIARAGQAGVVTVATNVAGRGTDVILSPDVLKAGGLHVVMTFFAESERVEAQALGRAGRQGQPGSGRLILGPDEPGLDSGLDQLDHEPTAALQAWRSTIERSQSEQRSRLTAAAVRRHAYLRQFSQGLNSWYKALDEQTMGRIAAKMTDLSGRFKRDLERCCGEGKDAAGALRKQLSVILTSGGRSGQADEFVDWLRLLKTCRRDEMLTQWSEFYSELRSETLDSEATVSAEDRAFGEVTNTFGPSFSAPEQEFFLFLTRLLEGANANESFFVPEFEAGNIPSNYSGDALVHGDSNATLFGELSEEFRRGATPGRSPSTAPVAWDYRGNIRDGAFQGHGRLAQADGMTYEGMFIRGLYHGAGNITLANGQQWRGEFSGGRKTAAGEYLFADGIRVAPPTEGRPADETFFDCIRQRDAQGDTPLWNAIVEGRTQTAISYIKRGEYGVTESVGPLSLEVAMQLSGQAELRAMVTHRDALLEREQPYALHVACSQGNSAGGRAMSEGAA